MAAKFPELPPEEFPMEECFSSSSSSSASEVYYGIQECMEVKSTRTSSPSIYAELSDWDPMRDDYYSVQNLLYVDQDSPEALILGVKDIKKGIHEIPCPFYTTGTTCWKGRSCRMLHKKVDVMDMGKERIFATYSLNQKPKLWQGMCLDVIVKNVVSPSEFYVMPVTKPSCMCSAPFPKTTLFNSEAAENPKEGEEEGNVQKSVFNDFGTGFSAFKNLTAALNKFLEPNMYWRRLQQPHYAQFQLVAFKTVENNKRQWLRAEIVKPNVNHAFGRVIPRHVIRLLDVGKIVCVPADELCLLPGPVCRLPSMVFKCSLNGVVPVKRKWHSNVMETFIAMVSGRELSMTVVECNSVGGICRTFEVNPYLVDLTFMWKSGSAESSPVVRHSVSNYLADQGLVRQLSDFPYRPELKGAVCSPGQQLIITPKKKKLAPLVQHFERQRLFDYWNSEEAATSDDDTITSDLDV